MFLRRAVDDEGEVLDLFVQRRRDTEATLVLLKRLLRNQPVEPERIVTDGLRSYPAALEQLGLSHLNSPGRRTLTSRSDDESDSSSYPSSKPQPNIFVATQEAIYNAFYTPRHLVSRSMLRRFRAGADEAWVAATA